MPGETTIPISLLQTAATVAACVCFGLAFWLELRWCARPGETAPGEPTRGNTGISRGMAIGAGVVLMAVLLAGRAASAGRLTLPLSDYFDAFLLLGLLLAGLWAWLQWTRHLRNLAIFLLPMMALLILLGAVLDWAGYRKFPAANPWEIVHVGSLLLGAACFAAGCVGGVVWLLADRRLRAPNGSAWRRIPVPPLASVEKINRHAILLGFPLLTIGALSGVLWAVQDPRTMGPQWFLTPKVILTAVIWLIYASLLHVRLAPSWRGARAAWLSILGFVLLLVVFAAVNWMPSG